MSGLLDSIRVLVKSGVRQMVTKAEDANAIPVLEERFRELTDKRKQGEAQLSQFRYNLTTAQTHLDAEKKNEEKIGNDIRTLMGANGGNPSAAQKAEASRGATIIANLRRDRPNEEAQIERMQADFDALRQAIEALTQQETEIKQKIGELRSKAAMAKTYEGATKTLTAAQEAVGAAGAIGSIEDNLNRKAAVASDAFNRALSETSSGSDAELRKLEADDVLKEFMASPSGSKAA